MFGKSTRRHTKLRKNRTWSIETLESRQMMAADILPSPPHDAHVPVQVTAGFTSAPITTLIAHQVNQGIGQGNGGGSAAQLVGTPALATSVTNGNQPPSAIEQQLKDALKSLQDQLNKWQTNESAAVRNQLDSTVKSLQNKIDALKKEISSFEHQIGNTQDAIDRRNDKIKELRKDIKNWKSDIDGWRHDIHGLEHRLGRFAPSWIKKDINKLKDKVDDTDDKIDAATKKIERYQDEIDDLAHDLKTLNKQVTAAENAIKKLVAQINDARQKAGDKLADIGRQAKKAVQTLPSLSAESLLKSLKQNDLAHMSDKDLQRWLQVNVEAPWNAWSMNHGQKLQNGFSGDPWTELIKRPLIDPIVHYLKDQTEAERVDHRTPSDPDRSTFHIEINFVSTFTKQQINLIQQAVQRWEQIIVGGIGGNNKIRIDVGIKDIIDPKDPNVVGVGGFENSNLYLNLKTSFLEDLTNNRSVVPQDLVNLATHEIGHVLGVGARWGDVPGTRVVNGLYTGVNATREYNAIFHTSADGVPTDPVHPGHWSEDIFGDEMMSPVLPTTGSGNPALISSITIGALADLGYKVDYSKADAFLPPAANTEAQTAFLQAGTQINNANGADIATALEVSSHGQLSPVTVSLPQAIRDNLRTPLVSSDAKLLDMALDTGVSASHQLPSYIYDAAVISISKFEMLPVAQLFGGNMMDANVSG